MSKRTFHLWLTSLALALLWPRLGAAQLAPTGAHYAGRPSDTGHAGPNDRGGYAASIPLDLPPARGGLPIPLQIVSGTRGFGAAGVGWDIPLSFVYVDRTFARRRPVMEPGTRPTAREHVTVSLPGRQIEMLPRADNTWIGRFAPDVTMTKSVAALTVLDGNGLTYTFTKPKSLAHTGGPFEVDAGLWLLTSIRGAGGSTLSLTYDVQEHQPGSADALSIDLSRVSYNRHPSAGCFKHEIQLDYDTPVAHVPPQAIAVMGARTVIRVRKLIGVNVTSRATCNDAPQSLRRYALSYVVDPDTQQDRVASVAMYGRLGTAEATIAIPVASFSYGSATTHKNGERVLSYALADSVLVPSIAGPNGIANTKTVSTSVFASPLQAGFTKITGSFQSFTDVTGDGRPDLIYENNGKLNVARNAAMSGGRTALAQPAQLNDNTFTRAVLDVRAAAYDRFDRPSPTSENAEYVWTQAIDVNGDGRVDIVDAAEKPNHWIIYLNTPDSGPSGIRWERRAYDVTKLHYELMSRNHAVPDDYVPLSRRYTAAGRTAFHCWKYDRDDKKYYLAVFVPPNVSQPDGACHQPNGPTTVVGPEQTYVEWELKDINGDGFPDVVFNSSRVELIRNVDPVPEGTDPPEYILHESVFEVRPVALPNDIEAVLNVAGVFVSGGNAATDPFASPIRLRTEKNKSCGVGLWSRPYGADSSADPQLLRSQEMSCGLVDVNGDGLVDRIEDGTAFLGTGSWFLPMPLVLPGAVAVQTIRDPKACESGGPDLIADQSRGLRDVTGDGIPDLIEMTSEGRYQVYIGTSGGFRPLSTGWSTLVRVDGGFGISRSHDACDSSNSRAMGGMYDIDGDGTPDVVSLIAGSSGHALDVYKLVTYSGSRVDLGRITQLDNGYGASTTIRYRSAKEDATTKHQVPYPEVVVASVETKGMRGFGGTLAATHYAYGDIELSYDSMHDAFRSTGYRRRVELQGVSVAAREGIAKVIDRYPLEPVSPWTLPYLTDRQRFGRYLRAGRVSDVTVLAGGIGSDAWSLLRVDTNSDPRRIAGAHYDVDTLDTRLFGDASAASNDVCKDVMFPYDYDLSVAHNYGAYNPCSARGFLYARATSSWRGSAAPPSASNVQTLTSVRSVDDYGRVTSVFHQNDAWRSDDDVCVDTAYATQAGQEMRVLSAVSSRKVWSCAPEGGPNVTYAQEAWEYDKLPVGLVSQGLVTSHTVYRHATDTGQPLGAVREYDVDYDATANPFRIVQVRGDDGATRTATITYDAFGLAAVHTSVAATGIPTLEAYQSIDPITGNVLSTRDENGTERGTTFDGFGRPRFDTVTTPDGANGVLVMRSYLGFEASPTPDPSGRRLMVKEFTNPVASKDVLVEEGRISTTFLDELGRPRFGQVLLGDDYANERLVVGKRIYDALGRVAFEADPFPASQDPETAYGTTQYFDTDGFLGLSIRGRGWQPRVTTPDASIERFPSVFRRTFANHTASTTVQAADALTPGSPQYGVTGEEVSTAIGRTLTRSTWRNGTRLEHAALTHDRLGGQTKMIRFQNASGVSNPVEWSWRLDSRGQILSLTEPSSAPQQRTYSDWGELLRVTWTPPSPEPYHSIQNAYDALGRLIYSVEDNGGVWDADTAQKYSYDVAQQASPLVAPTYVRGRLAAATSTATPAQTVSFSYDGFGRVNARTHADGNKGIYIEKHGFHGDGSQAWLELNLPDNKFAPERVDYAYDSAGRLRWMWSSDGTNTQQLFQAAKIDAFGRLRSALVGKNIEYTANHAELGRRLPIDIKVSSGVETRYVQFSGFDPVGRELSRNEDTPFFTGKQTSAYDTLGRLHTSLRVQGASTPASWTFNYDPLGNVVALTDNIGTASAWLSYQTTDRDRICNITFAPASGFGCNVAYDGVGNIIHQPTRAGYNKLAYLNAGNVRTIENQSGAKATFRYDPFGAVQSLDISAGADVVRSDQRFGAFISQRYQSGPVTETKYISRQFPGPGLTISRRGPQGPWIYQFSDSRGMRFTTDQEGRFVQDVDYTPFGEAAVKGAAPGTAEFSTEQWNDGDALEQFGLVHLGARLYDPVSGRFLSRDPLLIPRTAATTNPYAFAFNDPLNFGDPSGLDPCAENLACGGPNLVTTAVALGRLGADVFSTTGVVPDTSFSSHAERGAYLRAFDTRVELHNVLREEGAENDIDAGDVVFGALFGKHGTNFWTEYKARGALISSWPWEKRLAFNLLELPIVGSFFKSGAEWAMGNRGTAASHAAWGAFEIFTTWAGTRLRGNQGAVESGARYFKGRQSLGAAAATGRTGVKGLLKDAGLPHTGKIRFVPEAHAANTGIRKGPNGGFVDRFGNVWQRPKGHLVGEVHWDVQLSATGRAKLGWASNSGYHINVSRDGRIVH